MQDYQQYLKAHQKTWLVTGVAGFIGSNILETLLKLNQKVVGLDNFSTGYQKNLEYLKKILTKDQWLNFKLVEGDITDLDICRKAVETVEIILHQAALGSVPRSIENPLLSHHNNLTGFLNILVAAKEAGIKRFVYASSSSVYGDSEHLPKVEGEIGNALSPYAVTKYGNELYAGVFARCYGLETVGLRYFNVFGSRQDPEGAYAAVIPKWIGAMLKGESVYINGDGETSRDFTYVDNVVQMNLLAGLTPNHDALNQIYNVAVGGRETLNNLFMAIREELAKVRPDLAKVQPVYREFRAGDIRHSNANISKAQRLLAYKPTHTLLQGLSQAMPWYLEQYCSKEFIK